MRPSNSPLLLLVLCAAAAARRLTVVPQPALTDAVISHLEPIQGRYKEIVDVTLVLF